MKKKTIGIIILVAMLLIAMCLISACSTGEESPKQEGTSTATVSETTTPEATPETKPEVKPEVKPETKPEPTTPEPAKSETKPETKSETKPETTTPETKPEPKPTEPPKPQTPTIDQSTCNHQWPDWTIVKSPTTTEEGVKERSCQICGKIERGSIEKEESSTPEYIAQNGQITPEEFDAFISYASNCGYILEGNTLDPYISYYLRYQGEFPCFSISGGRAKYGNIYMTFYPEYGVPSEGSMDCHTIDEAYSFFDGCR